MNRMLTQENSALRFGLRCERPRRQIASDVGRAMRTTKRPKGIGNASLLTKFVFTILVPLDTPLPNQQSDGFPLEFLLKASNKIANNQPKLRTNPPKIRLRTNKQNYEQTGVSEGRRFLPDLCREVQEQIRKISMTLIVTSYPVTMPRFCLGKRFVTILAIRSYLGLSCPTVRSPISL